MRRTFVSLTAPLATLAIAGAALAAGGATTATKGPVKINVVTTYAEGTSGGFCNFRVVVRYSGKPRSDFVRWYLTTGGATGDSAGFSLGPTSPASGTAGFQPPPAAGTYHFLVQIKNHKGAVVAHAKTSTFSLTGSCPAPAKLGTYKRRAASAGPGASIQFEGLKRAVQCFPGAQRPHERRPVSLSWNAATPSAETTYNVFMAKKPGGEDFRAPNWSTHKLSFATPRLPPGRYFVVRAKARSGAQDHNRIEKRAQNPCV